MPFAQCSKYPSARAAVGMIVVLLCLAMAPSMAHGATVQDPLRGTLDTTQLPNGTYTVDVKLVQKSNIGQASMASSAVEGTHELTVEDGSYTLALELGSIGMAGSQNYMDTFGYYPSYSVSGSAVSTNGDATNLWRSANPQGELGEASVPLDENVNSFAKSLGYVPVVLGAPNMPVTPQDAVLAIDWSSLKATSAPEEPSSDEPSSEPDEESSQGQEPAPVDKSGLSSAIDNATQALAASQKVQSAKDALSGAISTAQAVLDNQSATQDQVNAARSALQEALNAHNTAQNVTSDTSGQSQGGGSQQGGSAATTNTGTQASSPRTTNQSGLQAGHVYAVPLVFKKAGSAETSMANQYFGDAAYVRPLADGSLDVRFTTNRADYVLALQYNGARVEELSSSGNAREYRLVIPGGNTDRVLPITMTIKPMEDLGAGPVNSDMYLYLTQAADQGGDTGQVAPQSKNSGTLSPAGAQTVAVAAGSAPTATAKTGDRLPLHLLCFAAASALGALLPCFRRLDACRRTVR